MGTGALGACQGDQSQRKRSKQTLGEHKPGRIKPGRIKRPLYPSKTACIIYLLLFDTTPFICL